MILIASKNFVVQAKYDQSVPDLRQEISKQLIFQAIFIMVRVNE